MGKQHTDADAISARARLSVFYSRRDAANLLGVCVNTLRGLGDPTGKYFDSTCPPAQSTSAGKVGYDKSAFDHWLKNRPLATPRSRSKQVSLLRDRQ